jgi:hypothetical protein
MRCAPTRRCYATGPPKNEKARWLMATGRVEFRKTPNQRPISRIAVTAFTSDRLSPDEFAPIQRVRPGPRSLRLVQPIASADKVVRGGKIVGGVRNHRAPSMEPRTRFQRARQTQLKPIAPAAIQNRVGGGNPRGGGRVFASHDADQDIKRSSGMASRERADFCERFWHLYLRFLKGWPNRHSAANPARRIGC